MSLLLDQPPERTKSLSVKVPSDLPERHPWQSWLRVTVEQAALRAMVPLQMVCEAPCEPGSFGILMYHRVARMVPGAEQPTWNVTPQRLKSQLVGLGRRGFSAWPLRKLLDWQAEGRIVPPRTFVVTFDDGYENNYLDAFPILQKLNVPFTIFLATAYLDAKRPFPSDDWPEAGSLRAPPSSWRPLSTEQCREMLASGIVDLGTHTHTHDDYRGRADELYTDLRESLAILKDKFNLDNATFAFPYGTPRQGFCSPEMQSAARRAGVLCSLSTSGRHVSHGSDPFTWGRVGVRQSDSAATLAAKLDGWYAWARGVFDKRFHSQANQQ